jgi:flagellar motor component MotA
MDVLSLIGIILAFVAIIGGNFLEGGHLGALANGPAALIVLGGTLAAALLQSPRRSSAPCRFCAGFCFRHGSTWPAASTVWSTGA